MTAAYMFFGVWIVAVVGRASLFVVAVFAVGLKMVVTVETSVWTVLGRIAAEFALPELEVSNKLPFIQNG